MLKQSTGFTLIEILITVFLISGGLLGVAALQAISINSNQAAYNRSQATLLAYDIVDRMRANPTEASLLGGSRYTTIFPFDAKKQEDCLKLSADCNPDAMAEQDLYDWFNQIRITLPGCANDVINGSCATIIANDAGNGYVITINWDEDRNGDIDDHDASFQINAQLL